MEKYGCNRELDMKLRIDELTKDMSTKTASDKLAATSELAGLLHAYTSLKAKKKSDERMAKKLKG